MGRADILRLDLRGVKRGELCRFLWIAEGVRVLRVASGPPGRYAVRGAASLSQPRLHVQRDLPLGAPRGRPVSYRRDSGAWNAQGILHHIRRGRKRRMAHVDFRSSVRVGKYGVDVLAFDRIVLACAARRSSAEADHRH